MTTKAKAAVRDDDFGGFLADRYGSMSRPAGAKKETEKKPAEKKQAAAKKGGKK